MIMIGQSVTRVKMRNASFISGWVENRQHTMAQPRKNVNLNLNFCPSQKNCEGNVSVQKQKCKNCPRGSHYQIIISL